jgi:SAM-dependent methyltransferase
MSSLGSSRRRIFRALAPFRVSVKVRRKKEIGSAFWEADANVRADGYLPWLCTVVGGWLDAGSGNLRAFDHAVRHVPSGGAVLEIGSFLGLSTCALAHLLRKYEKSHAFFNCDPWEFEEADAPIGGVFDASSLGFRAYARSSFVRNIETFCSDRRPFSIEADSNAFFADWSEHRHRKDLFGREVELGGPISFAYIDGAHTVEASGADFRNVDRFLLPGGFVLFDDSDDGGPFGSTRTAQQVARDARYELVFKAPNYLFRKR